MRALVDLVEGITGSFQRLVMTVVGFGIVIWIVFMVGVATTAPVVADQMGERAERFGEKALQAAVEERRSRELAKDGWGYSGSGSATTGSARASGTTRDKNGEAVGGWGSE